MGPPVTCVLSSPNASGAAHGPLSEALHKPGGGSLARAGGLPELAYGGGQGHELHREEVFNDKSEQLHCSFGTCPPSRVMHAHLEIRAGKSRATATSIDAMWRLASTRATPMWMQPEGPAAVTTSDALPKRYFVPKPPSPRGPPNSECTPRRHGGASPPHSSEPTASRRTALGRGGGTARAGPSTRASAHTTCTTPSPV